jgi:anti-sigma regulatory factor (Ser/Thr protein kinase)
LNAQELSVRLAPEPTAVAEARVFIRDVLGVWGVDGMLAQTAGLLASELVTNSILHAAPPIDLTLDWTEPRLRVEVRDRAQRMPEMVEPPRPAGRGGYGLHIIEQLSHAWGARLMTEGKVVWFEIRRVHERVTHDSRH